MIVGIGTDLCRISRMEKALASPAFFHRVFGPEEQALLDIIHGRIHPLRALLGGKIRVRGDKARLMALISLMSNKGK